MKRLTLILPFLVALSATACGSQSRADADACAIFIQSFADLMLLLPESDASTSSLVEVNTAINSTVTEAELAEEMAASEDLKALLLAYTAAGNAASAAFDNLIIGIIDNEAPVLMGVVGGSGEKLIHYCARR